MAERNTGSALTAVYLARALRITDKCIEAQKVIERAIQLAPETAEAHFERGSIESCQNHVEEAEKSFQEALRLDPERTVVNIALGEMYCSAGGIPIRPYLISRGRFNTIPNNPDDAQAYYDLGSAYLKKDQIDAAHKFLTRAIQLDPGHPRAHYLLGKVLQRQGKKTEAEEELALAEKLQAQEHRRLAETFESIAQDR